MVGKLKVHLVLLHCFVLESYEGLIYQVFPLQQANQKKRTPYLKVPQDVCLWRKPAQRPWKLSCDCVLKPNPNTCLHVCASENRDAATQALLPEEGWGSRVVRKRSLSTPAYDDDIRTSMGISIPFLSRLCQSSVQHRRLNARRVYQSPAESVSLRAFTAHCTTQCSHRTSDPGTGLLSRTHRGSWCPFNPNMVFTYEAWRLWINSWYTINWKFKKRNLKQPKSGSCWSPLPRLPGEYT